jgi:hypothetical protein
MRSADPMEKYQRGQSITEMQKLFFELIPLIAETAHGRLKA